MKKIKKVLLLGSGPIIIGQACEFDYSGVQACKSLKEEGVKVILLNSNPASIMTDYKVAYKTYIEPMCLDNVTRIIIKEKPEGIIGGFGGQTSLNLLIKLYKKKILKKFNIKVLGTSIKSIINSENRKKFRNILLKKKLPVAFSKRLKSLNNCLKCRKEIIKKSGNDNLIIRPSYTLGGLGSGISYCKKDFYKLCKLGLKLSINNEILIEESLCGWKEFEMEIIADKKSRIVVCSIENIDPVGIHTGDSVTISPVISLTDKELQILRNTAFLALKALKIKNCGCNIQFATNPKTGNLKIIEINPRVSRSSALASKITGYPIAKITAKLLIGYSLDKLRNKITNNIIPAFFEPSIDYVALKFPRFCNEKFINVNDFVLGTQMKSIGETMAIGSTFEETIQKSLRSNEDDKFYFSKIFQEKINNLKIISLRSSCIYYIYDLIRIGIKEKTIRRLTNIEMWYILKIKRILLMENEFYLIRKRKIKKKNIINIKSLGFSDLIISIILKIDIIKIFKLRNILKIFPKYRKIDTCAGEFDSNTSYLYSTFFTDNKKNKSNLKKNKKVVIIGSGPNKIGQGLEFDYCCTHASEELKKLNYKPIMVNCNPETVSTDYDISDKLYFEPLYYEDIYNIYKNQNPLGVIIQFGGQTSLKLSNFLEKINFKILGTNSKATNLSENRKKFRKFLKKIKIVQPKGVIIKNKFFKKINLKFPVLVRPSFVLGGRMMKKIFSLKKLRKYIYDIPEFIFPVLIDEFLEDATEFDIDCVSNGVGVFIPKIIHHVERAGIHSGDSAFFIPSLLSKNNRNNIRKIVKAIALKMNIIGLMNVQLAIKNNKIYILEVNPRASRTITFINKCCNFDMVSFSIFCILFKHKLVITNLCLKIDYFFVKESVFSFIKFRSCDPILGPEMKSTGEVLTYGDNFRKTFLKSQISIDNNFIKGNFVIFIRNCKNLFFLKFLKKKFKNDIFIYKIKYYFNFFKYIFLFKKKISLVVIQELKLNKKEETVIKKIRKFFKNNNTVVYTTNIATLCLLNSLKKFKINRKEYNLNEIYKIPF